MIRVLHLTTCSPKYLARYFAHHRERARLPYRAQLQALLDDCFGWADFWTRPLAKYGFELSDIVVNAKSLQHTWARERGLAFDRQRWLPQIALAQASVWRPEIVFAEDFHTVDAALLRELRNRCPSVRAVIGHCGAPHAGCDAVACWDLALSNIKAYVDEFRAQGRRAEYLPHAFSTQVLERMAATGGPRVPFSFVGSMLPEADHHVERIATLQQLARATSIAIYAPTPTGWQERLRRLLRSEPARPLDPVIRRRLQPPRFGLAMFDLLARSDVSFNQHIDVARGNASNMRLFEATGVGSCLLTDAVPDLAELFDEDREVATYRSAGEAIDKARYLLEHDAARQAIAVAGRQRTLRDHTFEQRAPLLADLLRRSLG